MLRSSINQNKSFNRLQKDILQIEGKTIFINPFLYWKRFDKPTNIWLRQLGQISAEEIKKNRNRFYPDLDWSLLTNEEQILKNGTIEMFLKTLDLVSKFHPFLNSNQILEVERKMLTLKKESFQNWVKKALSNKARAEINAKRNFQREMIFHNWREWAALEATQQAILPIIVIIFISAFIGWSAGISRNSCHPYFESNLNNQI